MSLCLFAYLTLSRGTDTDYLTMLSLTSEKTGREKPVTVRLRSYLTIEESSLLNTCKSNGGKAVACRIGTFLLAVLTLVEGSPLA